VAWAAKVWVYIYILQAQELIDVGKLWMMLSELCTRQSMFALVPEFSAINNYVIDWCVQVTLSKTTSFRCVSVKFHREFHCIKYTNVANRDNGSPMGCEESSITMKLHWHGYLVFSLGNCAYETCSETSLRCINCYFSLTRFTSSWILNYVFFLSIKK
jgi:hypothetical protein